MNNCIECDNTTRYLNNSYCVCRYGYFEYSMSLPNCVKLSCHPTCSDCLNNLITGCLSCISSHKRELIPQNSQNG